MVTHFEVQHLLDGGHLIEGEAYFNVGTQKSDVYLKSGAY